MNDEIKYCRIKKENVLMAFKILTDFGNAAWMTSFQVLFSEAFKEKQEEKKCYHRYSSEKSVSNGERRCCIKCGSEYKERLIEEKKESELEWLIDRYCINNLGIDEKIQFKLKITDLAKKKVDELEKETGIRSWVLSGIKQKLDGM